MRAGHEQENGVQIQLKQLVVVGVSPLDSVVLSHGIQNPGGNITQSADLKQIIQLPEIGQVHDLGDCSTTNHTNPDTRHSQASRTPVIKSAMSVSVSSLFR